MSGSLQDDFLKDVKDNKIEVTVFLMNGFQMKGLVVDYDKYVIHMSVNQNDHIIYKHAISTFQK